MRDQIGRSASLLAIHDLVDMLPQLMSFKDQKALPGLGNHVCAESLPHIWQPTKRKLFLDGFLPHLEIEQFVVGPRVSNPQNLFRALRARMTFEAEGGRMNNVDSRDTRFS